MQVAATVVLTGCFIIVISLYFFSLHHHRQQARARQKRAQQERQLALELHPAYQAKKAADRNHELALAKLQLAREKQETELQIAQKDAALRVYTAIHRIPAEMYIINEEIRTVTALPSLKPQPADKASIAGSLPFQIPPPYDLLDVFRQEEITPERIFLGKRADAANELLFVKASQLHHAAFSASTGYGKTTLIRGIIAQLLYIRHHVVIADLKYTDVTEKGDDFRPIAARMMEQPPLEIAPGYRLPNVVRKEDQIATLLHWMAYPEMERRLDMRARKDYSYPTLDVFLEELVALMLAYPSVSKDIIRIISLGRELRLNLFTTAQNMQVSSIGMSGGAREQFTTAWFLGGDEISAAALLDMPRKELSDFLHGNNIVLGQGIGMMRNNYILPTAGVVRLGYTSNDSVYHLLDKADDFSLPTVEAFNQKHRSYSVPQTPRNAVTQEHPRTPTENGEERTTEPLYSVPQAVPQEQQTADCNPFLLFTEEQRTAILDAAKQPGMSLRKIRTQAKIGNDTKRFSALKIWLEMNGCTLPETAKKKVEA